MFAIYRGIVLRVWPVSLSLKLQQLQVYPKLVHNIGLSDENFDKIAVIVPVVLILSQLIGEARESPH